MDSPSSPLVEILLSTGRTLALRLSDKLAIRVVHNAPLLVEWRGHTENMPAALPVLLRELLPAARAGEILQQVLAVAPDIDDAGVELGISPLRVLPGGGPDRYAALSLHRAADSDGPPLLLLMRDVTALETRQHALRRAQQSCSTALAVLRAPPTAIRLFLTRAMTAIGDLRGVMKQPAHDQESVHAKLSQLLQQLGQLGADAAESGIEAIAQSCSTFAGQVAALRDQPVVSGDELLPLARLMDRVASSVGDCLRIEEQRHIAPTQAQSDGAPAAGSAERPKEAREWARSAERGWNSFLRRHGQELGTLVKLRVQDAHLVPPGLRRDVDGLLQHLLRNALDHGIETPEQRLASEKPASGEIIVRFRDLGPQGLTMSVRDDGRGFDVERIGRAAVLSGVLSEESLLEYEPGEIVGLIFKPAFSTANLEGEAGRGRGMNYLRRAVAQLGGQITVATKPGIYTRFVVQFPPDAGEA